MKKKVFNPDLKESFKLSRSKIDLFLQCPRCFYHDRKLGISHPSGAPFTLNNLVDTLLKKSFDAFRLKKSSHPFQIENGINAIPFDHSNVEDWRNNRKGIRYVHEKTNFEIYGAIDDVWVKSNGELIIVDYKAKASKDDPNTFLTPKTKKNGEIVKTERYKISYKKQIEVYQWLFRKNGFKVSDTAYFVFANAQKDRDSFDDKLDFEKILIPYVGDTSWVEPTLFEILDCLSSEEIPEFDDGCEFCKYHSAIMNHLQIEK